MKELIEKVQRRIDTNRVLLDYKQSVKTILSESRYYHSLACAAVADKIARSIHLQEDVIEKCLAAGILHDITKEFHKNAHRELVQNQNYSIELDEFPESLWHAITGEVYVRTHLQVEDPEILEAIRFHTTGRSNMGILAKIVYAADYFSSRLEPHLNIDKPLDVLCLEKAVASLLHLIEKNKPVHHDTIDFYHHLIERVYGE